MSTDPRTERMHRMSHGFLRSQAKCPQCDYVAPMDGPDRIVAALDRLTAALLAAASPPSSPVDTPPRPTGTPGPSTDGESE